MKVKLIQHLLYSGLGGPGAVFFSLFDADKNKEYSYSAVFCGIEPVRDEYIQSCRNLEIPQVYVQKKKGLDIKVYWKLFRHFSKSRPDILFLHGVSFIMPAIWYRFFRLKRRIIVRDTQAHHLKSKLEWVWLFISVLFANRLVVLSPEAAAVIRKKFGWFVSKKKIEIIPNGLNVELFCPLQKEHQQKKIVIGMQSRLQPIKDYSTLLKAFKLLQEKLPDYYLSLHIAGDGVTRQSIENTIDELKIRDSVMMHGMLSSSELVSFLQSLDIYVHATFGETLSNSIMQAMACALPVVASDVWGVNNMIKNEETGVLYESGNAAQLAEILQQFIGDTGRRKRLGETARIFAENNYSESVMFNRYNQVFTKLIK